MGGGKSSLAGKPRGVRCPSHTNKYFKRFKAFRASRKYGRRRKALSIAEISLEVREYARSQSGDLELQVAHPSLPFHRQHALAAFLEPVRSLSK